MATDYIIGNLKHTGINQIDAEKVVSKWNSLWWILQWKDEYRLIKYRRKDSPITTLKTDISKEQAAELIYKLNLKPYPGTFKSATSWKQ